MTLRPRWEEALPPRLAAQLAAYESERNGRAWCHAIIPTLAPSTNQIWRFDPRSKRAFKNPDAKANAFAQQSAVAFWGKRFASAAAIAVVLGFESQAWMTKTREISRNDADNRVKVTLDSVAKSLDFRDEQIFECSFYKIIGRYEATHVWLFDLGDVVPAYLRHAHS